MTARLVTALSVAAALLATGACGASNARPYLTPFPDDPVDTLLARADVVVQHLGLVFQGDSLPLRTLAPAEGYLETEWFDVVRWAGDSTAQGDHPVVKLRFWVDPIGQGLVQVVGEAATRRVVDPSLPPRQREVAVPATHPGGMLLDRLRRTLRERFPRPAGSPEPRAR